MRKPTALRRESADYRTRLHDSYVSTYFGTVRDPSLSGIKRDFPFFRHHFLRHLPPDRDAAILDLGCGYGNIVYTLREHGYRCVAGVDISPEQVELARRLGIEGVVEGNVLDHLRGAPGRYDVIFAVDLLEHLTKENVIDVVDAVDGALSPGGTFIVQTVNGASPFAGRARYGDFTHELAFTATSIAQVLRLGGFEAITVHSVEPPVHGIKSALRWTAWRIIRTLLVAYLRVEVPWVRGHIVSQNLIAVAHKDQAPSPARGGGSGGGL